MSVLFLLYLLLVYWFKKAYKTINMRMHQVDKVKPICIRKTNIHLNSQIHCDIVFLSSYEEELHSSTLCRVLSLR